MLEVLTIPLDGVVSSNQRTKMMCLFDMIKSNSEEDDLLSCIIRTNSIRLIDMESAPTSLVTWKKFVESALCHNQVVILVDDLNSNASGKLVKASSEKVSMKFVDSPIRNLRDFTAAITKILYIIFEKALFCVALHEYSHAGLRQVENNPNTSIPNLLSNKSALVETYGDKSEFGRFSEHKLFGCQLDFWKTDATGKWTELHSAYFSMFAQAIERNRSLPSFNGSLPPCSTRTSRCTIGSDINIKDVDIC